MKLLCLSLSLMLTMSMSAQAQSPSQADLYRLTNEIQETLDRTVPDLNQTAEAANHLQQALNVLRTPTIRNANLVISDGPTYDFGTIVVNGIAEKSFVITNTGNVSL